MTVLLNEINCPNVARDKHVTQLTVTHLELAPNGKLRLKHDHDYMYQVQGNKHITRKNPMSSGDVHTGRPYHC